MLNEGQVIILVSLVFLIVFIYTFYYAVTLPMEKNKK